MNIYGFGSDIVDIIRFKKILIKNKKFKERIFAKTEIVYCSKKKNSTACFAKRFAAKEAFSKALGTGISNDISFKEIVIKNDVKKKPNIIILGNSLKQLIKIIKKKKYKIFVSLSDEKKYAMATVIITK